MSKHDSAFSSAAVPQIRVILERRKRGKQQLQLLGKIVPFY